MYYKPPMPPPSSSQQHQHRSSQQHRQTSSSTQQRPSHHHHHQHSRSSQQQQQSPPSISDDRLGLSSADLATLRQHQALAHRNAAAAASSSTHNSSPAASQASSQGRLLLDPGSLSLLARHFDRVMQAIGARIDQLTHATETFTSSQSERAGNTVQQADAEIARFRTILQQIDELETEFEKIKRIREMVRGWRARVEGMERRLG